MLIRTYGELDALPDDSCVIDNQGLVHQKHDGQWRTWVEYGKIAHSDFPLTLIHPRRYGDEDAERVVDAMQASRFHDPSKEPWSRYRDFYRGLARAALNALETEQ